MITNAAMSAIAARKVWSSRLHMPLSTWRGSRTFPCDRQLGLERPESICN
jgi:hypothetical protein